MVEVIPLDAAMKVIFTPNQKLTILSEDSKEAIKIATALHKAFRGKDVRIVLELVIEHATKGDEGNLEITA